MLGLFGQRCRAIPLSRLQGQPVLDVQLEDETAQAWLVGEVLGNQCVQVKAHYGGVRSEPGAPAVVIREL